MQNEQHEQHHEDRADRGAQQDPPRGPRRGAGAAGGVLDETLGLPLRRSAYRATAAMMMTPRSTYFKKGIDLEDG